MIGAKRPGECALTLHSFISVRIKINGVGRSVGNRESMVLTVGRLWQFEFYVVDVNPRGSKSRRTFHVQVYKLTLEFVVLYRSLMST